MKRRSLLQLASAALAAPLAALLPTSPIAPPAEATATNLVHAGNADVPHPRPYEPDYEIYEDVSRQTTEIRLLKYGRTVTVSYEAMRRQRLDLFAARERS